MDKELFDDLIASCKDVIEFKKGNKQLKTTTLEISDEEIEESQLFYQQFEKLPKQSKKIAIRYVDELLQASNSQ